MLFRPMFHCLTSCVHGIERTDLDCCDRLVFHQANHRGGIHGIDCLVMGNHTAYLDLVIQFQHGVFIGFGRHTSMVVPLLVKGFFQLLARLFGDLQIVLKHGLH